MEYRLSTFSIWEAGARKDAQGNPHQEDSLYPAFGEAQDTDRLFVVCDGMGGHDSGEVASAVVCEALGESLSRRMAQSDGGCNERMLSMAINDAYRALDANDTRSQKKMGTTMAMIALFDKGYACAHIGDTRVYHIRPGADSATTTIMMQTLDHSLANKEIRGGTLSERERQLSVSHHVITRAMQPHMSKRSEADFFESADVKAGDYFMICTHGMFETLTDDYIRYIFSAQGGNDRNKLNLLAKATAKCTDNHSAMVVHILEVMSSKPKPINKPNKGMENSDNKNSGQNALRAAFNGGDAWGLLGKLMLGLMILLSLIMIIYYAFIHHNENPPKAGYAVDGEMQQQEYQPAEIQETYGYETLPSTPIDDEVLTENDGDTDLTSETAEDGSPSETAAGENHQQEDPASQQPAIQQPVQPAPQPSEPANPAPMPTVSE